MKAWEAQTESQLPWLLTTAHTSGGELGDERTPGSSQASILCGVYQRRLPAKFRSAFGDEVQRLAGVTLSVACETIDDAANFTHRTSLPAHGVIIYRRTIILRKARRASLSHQDFQHFALRTKLANPPSAKTVTRTYSIKTVAVDDLP